MDFESWISYRYLIAKKGRFLSFLHFVAIAGVAIGVMSLIVVIGVMTGFGNNLREKIIGASPHVVLEKETGIADYQKIREELAQIEGVVASSPFIQGNIFLEDRGHAVGQVVRGIDPGLESSVTKVKEYLIEGQVSDLTEEGLILGSELAKYFNYKVGDKVTLIAPGSGMSGRNWRYELTLVGIFTTGMIDFDSNLVFVHLRKAQEMFNLPADRTTGIGIKIENPAQAKEVKELIYKKVGYSYFVKTWIDVNRNLFDALFLEKWGLFIILTCMVIVASFNIISTLVVTVTSKIHDIGILKSFGVSKGSIQRIFIKQGLFVGIIGIFWGLVGGFGISYILRNYVKVPEQIYSIDKVPVELQMFDVLAIVISALLISYFATIYPAYKAAQLQPVEALRYE